MQTVLLGGHSALDPHLPISNRIVKRSCADDSVHSHVKVGHRQAPLSYIFRQLCAILKNLLKEGSLFSDLALYFLCSYMSDIFTFDHINDVF